MTIAHWLRKLLANLKNHIQGLSIVLGLFEASPHQGYLRKKKPGPYRPNKETAAREWKIKNNSLQPWDKTAADNQFPPKFRQPG